MKVYKIIQGERKYTRSPIASASLLDHSRPAKVYKITQIEFLPPNT